MQHGFAALTKTTITMKKIIVEMKDKKPFIVNKPDNCTNPNLISVRDCRAIHPSNPECGCFYCVFNKCFNQLNSNNNNEEEQSEE